MYPHRLPKVEFYQPIATIMKTKHAFIAANPKDVMGTSGHGNMTISYGKLHKAFGRPHDCTVEGPWRSADQKVRAEWAFKSVGRNPTVLTIYDYKDSSLVKQVTTWHIGAKGNLKAIGAFLEKKLGRNCFAEHRITLGHRHSVE